ncbi:hypothetical protein M885DRAFT_548810 [Pelagophyceae sp. CCMP2097]|nr:hypothetical protein M885DRAFT_548810 [Pelagophyceae sp. CCMP2097]
MLLILRASASRPFARFAPWRTSCSYAQRARSVDIAAMLAGLLVPTSVWRGRSFLRTPSGASATATGSSDAFFSIPLTTVPQPVCSRGAELDATISATDKKARLLVLQPQQCFGHGDRALAVLQPRNVCIRDPRGGPLDGGHEVHPHSQAE